MFLFIDFNKELKIMPLNSNTSHVLIYLLPCIFKPSAILFKYISCSYLSIQPQTVRLELDIQIHLMFLFITSNTTNQNLFIKFKYISCSYLSITIILLLNSPISFKYISCSYLSLKGAPVLNSHFYSNTSHVLIYPQCRL